MIRLFTKNATGVAPDGRWFAGDVNALEDAVAAINDLTQVLGLGTLQIGETGLQFLRYGAGEARLTGAMRTDGILRALGGLFAGTFTTAARDAIPAGFRPYGLVIVNTTTNQYEWNKGTDAAPNWQPISPPIGTGAITSGMILDGTIVDADLAADTLTARVIAADAIGASELANASVDSAAIVAGVAAGGTNYGTSFPTTGLFNGYRFTLFITNPASGSAGGDYIYRADIDGTYPWHACGEGVVLTHYVQTANNLNAQGAYVNLANVGPQIALVKAGWWEFIYSMRAFSGPGNGNDKAFMAYALTGGTAYGANDGDALILHALLPNILTDAAGTMQKVHGSVAAGTTVTSQYHQSDTSGFATCSFLERKLRARLIKGI